MTEPGQPDSPWTASPTAKEKNALQREIVALLDELAPEKVLSRGDATRLPIEQHRTPSGCVLQTPTAALTVSWFAPSGSDKTLGELHIIVWRGTVSRRGSRPPREGATLVKEMVLYPIERPGTPSIWRGADGTEYDTTSVAAKCLALLQEQTEQDAPPTG
jgi:hypothetical protein